jgi:hypothetical protein
VRVLFPTNNKPRNSEPSKLSCCQNFLWIARGLETKSPLSSQLTYVPQIQRYRSALWTLGGQGGLYSIALPPPPPSPTHAHAHAHAWLEYIPQAGHLWLEIFIGHHEAWPEAIPSHLFPTSYLSNASSIHPTSACRTALRISGPLCT